MKKFAKKLLVLLVAIVMTTVFNAVASSQESSRSYVEDSANLTYVVNSDGETVKITGYTGSVADLIVPETIDGYKVTHIATNAFLDCTTLTGLIIPDSVISIENYAFRNVSSLEEITLPFVGKDRTTEQSGIDFAYLFVSNSVGYIPKTLEKVTITDATQIPVDAFKGWTTVKTIVLPDTLKTIGNNAFYGCTGLTGDIYIPSGVTSIGQGAFYYCSGLTGDLVIPNGITAIERDTFNNCVGLTGTLVIPSTVTTIEQYAFFGCTGLTGTLELPDDLEIIGDYAFKNCTGITEVYVPNSVTSIGGSAFAGMSSLTEIKLPFAGKDRTTDASGSEFATLFGSSLGSYVPATLEKVTITDATMIPNEAFRGCSKIKTIVIPDTVTSIGNYAFYGCTSLTGNLYIPKAVTSIGSYAFYDCQGLTGNLIIPSNATTVGDGTFYRCKGLTGTLVIPVGVTEIGRDAFNGCSGLTGNLIIPSRVTSIGNNAFQDCPGFEGSLTIPRNVTTIGDYAFKNCSGITEVYVPNSVTSIGGSAFAGMSSLTEITLPFAGKDRTTDASGSEFATLFGSSLGSYVPATLEKVTITDATMIPNEAFKDCSKIKTIIIPATVTTIGSQAFYGCTALTGDIYIPSAVTSIGQGAFYNCRGLTGNLVIPNGITAIERDTFNNCVGLTGILVIPSTVTTIGQYAFSGCTGLTGTLVIPSTVTTIGQYVFSGCTGLTGTLELPDDLEIIGDYAFRNCSGITEVYVPNSVTSIGGSAFAGMSSLTEITLPFAGKDRTTDASGSEFATLFGSTNAAYLPQSLTKVTVTDTEQITADAFKDCKYIETIIIPDSVTSISNNAFSNCTALTELFIPMGVKTIGKDVFSNCKNLTVKCCMNSAMNEYLVNADIPHVVLDRLEIADGGSIAIDYDNRFVYGIENGFDSLAELVAIDDCSVSYDDTVKRIVNGALIDVYYGDRYVSSYTAIIFGDTNGDGWYNGMDATIVECLVNGMLTKDDVGEAVYTAADCNHDGVINAMDVALLNQAGLLFANIDQTKSEQELVTDSEYLEYIKLIDQTPDSGNDTVESETVIFTDFTALLAYIFEFIKKILSMIFATAI